MSWVSDVWEFYRANKDSLAPLLAPLGTILVGIGTVTVGIGTIRVSGQQARTATQQAETAAKQVEVAERQAVTTAFHNAVSRLASDKIEERLGGIYILERIARDSPDDHWPVMETLTAFVRERTKPQREKEASAPEPRASPPAWQFRLFVAPTTDIAAVFEVIKRRTGAGRAREQQQAWRLDLRGIDLRNVALMATNLEGVDLRGAHLQGADLREANLKGANLSKAHLEGADCGEAHLSGADLSGAHLEGGNLSRAYLEGADLRGAHLEGAYLMGAHLEGADLVRASLEDSDFLEAHLEGARFYQVTGNAATRLPKNYPRPEHWPPPEPGA